MTPLLVSPLGKQVTVVKTAVEGDVKKHFENLGIITGEHITPMSDNMGNIILKVKEGRLAINKGLATKIFVE